MSPDGRFGAAPNMTKMHVTQWGYGIKLPTKQPGLESTEYNDGAPSTDGIFITDLMTGRCRLLVSLLDIALAVGLNAHVPTYGFHVKWSPDGQLLMFVVRTMELAVRIDGLAGKRFRTQHLIVLNADGSNIRKILTWGSKPVHGMSIDWDGNHPNWVPDLSSHKISMNLALSDSEMRKKTYFALIDGQPYFCPYLSAWYPY